MAPVFMVLDKLKNNNFIYYAIKDYDLEGNKIIKIQQFDPESETEQKIKTLVRLQTRNIIFFNQVERKIFVVIDNCANIIILKKVDDHLIKIGNLFMHEEDRVMIADSKYSF